MANPFITVDQAKINGLSDLFKRLKDLPDKLQQRALKAAVRKGANLVKNAAIANAKKLDDPKTAEMIAKNVAVQFSAKQSKRQGGVVLRVGIRGGARQYADTRENRRKGRVGAEYVVGGDKTNPGGDTWYWRFLEFGTSRQGATPFMIPALRNNLGTATDAIAKELEKQINKLATEGKK